ncbi:OmpA family protein [Emticicia fluvialis]|uniref:OmpA family protein n=1 Tax=Emticicia fluvialis TaxID=2974474 RepID=UPI002165BE73|nr:OmpA family protein [Emticicia fluvialis]
MKKIYLLLLLLLAVESYGQIVTEFPRIDDQSSDETDITKVELRGEYTIIHFRYQLSKRKNRLYSFPLPNQEQKTYTTISFNPDSYLSANGKYFRYIKSVGIVELSDEQSEQRVYPGEVYKFSVYFEKLDPGLEVFNLVEGKNLPGQKLLFWNFNGVHIKNPPKNATRSTNPDVILTIRGKLIDARTQKTISGKVTYKVDKDTKKTGFKIVQLNEGFSFSLKPDAYTFTATAAGYETAETSIDLSKLRKGQQFTQDIYLNPVPPKTPEKVEPKAIPPQAETKPAEAPAIAAPKKEPAKEESAPVKVEENKFRLDKVYFNTGESGLLDQSYEQLDGLLKMMKNSPTMTIVIEGHTDNVGDPVQNKRLSLQRAFNVREYLVQKGIAGKRIQFKGYGDTKPITDNSTEEARKQNRRVEFIIVTP